MLDLAYGEDVAAAVDLNLVLTAVGEIVEIQGTAEKSPFTLNNLDKLMDLARSGINKIVALQREAVAG
jgi:ribonuclease PH